MSDLVMRGGGGGGGGGGYNTNENGFYPIILLAI